MPLAESEAIIFRAAELFKGAIRFEPGIAGAVAELGQGYPYFVQLIGKQCVNEANARETNVVGQDVLESVLEDLKSGKAFPTLESA